MDKKTFVRALGGVVVGGMLLTGGMAFADNIDGSDVKGDRKPFFGQAMNKKDGMFKGKNEFKINKLGLSESGIEQLVQDEIITEEKAKEIKDFIAKTVEERQARFKEFKNLSPEERKELLETGKDEKFKRGQHGLMEDLVTNNIITQEQADTITAKLKERAEEQRQKCVNDNLKLLVEQGIITQEQSEKVLEAFEVAKKEREAIFEKTKEMTTEERHQYMIENKGKIQNPVDQLVEDGVLTEEQAKAVGQIFFKGHRDGKKGFKG